MWRELQITMHNLARRPGLALACVLTIAVGIGCTTAVFSVVDGVLLDPLPYEDAERLVTVWQTFPEWLESDDPFYRSFGSRFPVSYPVYRDWVEMNPVFEALAAYDPDDFTVTGGDRPERVAGMTTSASLFEVLGVEPTLGRKLSSDEDRRGGDRVVVLSHDFWYRGFGGDKDVLGRILELDDVPHVVIGVMPEGFYFPDPSFDLWVPFRDDQRHSDRSSQSLRVVAKLRPGIDVQWAQAAMEEVTDRILEVHPEPRTGVRVVPHIDELVGEAREPLLLLVAAGGLLLMVATINVANLLMVRATERQRETATKLALGSKRRHLVRQPLVEGGILTAAGTVGGVLLAIWGLDLIENLTPHRMPRASEIGVDATVLGFTALVSVAVALLFALVPVLATAGLDPARVLRGGAETITGRKRNRVRAALVLVQVAVTVVLVVGAGLLVNSYTRLGSVDSGIEASNLLAFQLAVSEDRHSDLERFYREIEESLSRLPGVIASAEVEPLPLSGDSSSGVVAVEGIHAASDDGAEVLWGTVTPGYFEVMGIPVLRGRSFSESRDPAAPPVVAVNASLARSFWPEGDPIGRRIDLDGPGGGAWAEVVAVVGDVRQSGLRHEARPKVYVPFSEVGGDEDERSIVLRTAIDPLALIPAVREAVWSTAPGIAFEELASMEQIVSRRLAPDRFRTTLLGILAGVTALLAVVGIYGLVSYGVVQRTREIGMCRALGAEGRDVLTMVLKRSLSLVVAGELLGVLGALAGSRLLSGMLYGVEGTDPLTFALGLVVLTSLALLASVVPAWRAIRVEPMAALRAR